MKVKFIAAAVLASTLFVSCQKELSSETPTTPPGPGGGGGGGTADCKACIYTPTCNGMWHRYYDTTYDYVTNSMVPSLVADTLKYAKDTTIKGLVFQKFNRSMNYPVLYYNCTAGATNYVYYNLSGSTLGIFDTLDYIALKANEPVGATWVCEKRIEGEIAFSTYKIEAKGISRTLHGRTYTDVIFVSVKTTDVTTAGGAVINIHDGEYYYAKGIGMIEQFQKEKNTGDIDSHSVLKDFYIP